MRLRSVTNLLCVVTALLLFAVSFPQPAILFFQVSSAAPARTPLAAHIVKSGATMFVGGFAGPVFGNFAILANPLFLVGSVQLLRNRIRSSLICLAWALLCALQTFQLMILPYHEDEGGVMLSYMLRPLAGWYCWFGAILLVFLLAAARSVWRQAESDESALSGPGPRHARAAR